MATNEARSEEDVQAVDEIIGANVHTLMWRRKETQTTVAKDWGITAGALSLKIRGKRPWSAEDVHRAAVRYGIDPGMLFSRNMRMPDYESVSSNVVAMFEYKRHPRARRTPHTDHGPHHDQPTGSHGPH